MQTHKIPTVVVDGGDFGLEVYATLPLNDIVVAKTLIPRDVVEDPLAVHINPSFLEAENSASSEVDAAVVEIVADGDLKAR